MAVSDFFSLSADESVDANLSEWVDMPLVGDVLEGQPKERFYRVFDKLRQQFGPPKAPRRGQNARCNRGLSLPQIQSPSRVRAGIWEATAYAENLTDYPYNEIVFVVEGSISIVDADGHETRFGPGDSFFLKKGFNGIWRQHEKIRIFHMTVDPQDE